MSKIFNIFAEECEILHLKVDAGVGERDEYLIAVTDMVLDWVWVDDTVVHIDKTSLPIEIR